MSSVEVMALADMPFLQAKQILEQDPLPEKQRGEFHSKRSQSDTADNLVPLCAWLPEHLCFTAVCKTWWR